MARILSIVVLITVVSSTSAFAQQSVANLNNSGATVNWPEEYEPSKTSFYVKNEIEVKATPEVVWELLIRAGDWPEWYKGASDVEIVNSSERLLNAEAAFQWKTMGLQFISTIKEFQAPYRLSWESDKKSIKGYHAWLIVPTEQGCKVITEESQYGWLTILEKAFQPQKLRKLHQVWLEEIKKKAEQRMHVKNK